MFVDAAQTEDSLVQGPSRSAPRWLVAAAERQQTFPSTERDRGRGITCGAPLRGGELAEDRISPSAEPQTSRRFYGDKKLLWWEL